MQIERRSLQWDSDFFSFPVQRVDLKDFSKNETQALFSEISSHDAKLTYLFVPQKLESEVVTADFTQLFHDVKIGYEIHLDGLSAPEKPCPYWLADASSENALLPLALEAGKFSRFKMDPSIPSGKFEEFYRLWIKNSVTGKIADYVLVTGDKKSPTGFVTLKIDANGTANIGLIAIAPSHQGQGIGSDLIKLSLHYCVSRNIKTLNVYTQETNLGACAFYQKNSFRIFSKEHIFHIWKTV